MTRRAARARRRLSMRRPCFPSRRRPWLDLRRSCYFRDLGASAAARATPRRILGSRTRPEKIMSRGLCRKRLRWQHRRRGPHEMKRGRSPYLVTLHQRPCYWWRARPRFVMRKTAPALIRPARRRSRRRFVGGRHISPELWSPAVPPVNTRLPIRLRLDQKTVSKTYALSRTSQFHPSTFRGWTRPRASPGLRRPVSDAARRRGEPRPATT